MRHGAGTSRNLKGGPKTETMGGHQNIKLNKGNLNKSWQEKGHKDKLTVVEGLLLYGERIVVPQKLQLSILQKIHTGHQGFQKCYQRTSTFLSQSLLSFLNSQFVF